MSHIIAHNMIRRCKSSDHTAIIELFETALHNHSNWPDNNLLQMSSGPDWLENLLAAMKQNFQSI